MRLLSCILLLLTFSAPCVGMERLFEETKNSIIYLKNKEGKELECRPLRYDASKKHVQIELIPSKKKLWLDPKLLDTASQRKLFDWVMCQLIDEYLFVDADKNLAKKSTKNTAQETNYIVELRNMGKANIKDLKIEYRLYKKGADHSAAAGSSGSHTPGWTFVSGNTQIEKLEQGHTKEFETRSIAVIKSKVKTTYTVTYLSTGNSYNTGGKLESERDSLKGLAMHISYKGTVIKKWYSDRTLEDFINW